MPLKYTQTPFIVNSVSANKTPRSSFISKNGKAFKTRVRLIFESLWKNYKHGRQLHSQQRMQRRLELHLSLSLKCWCENFVEQEFTNSLSYCTCYFKIIFLVTRLCAQQLSAKTLRDKDWVIDVLTCLWLVDKEKIISIVWHTEGKIWNVLQNISPHQKWSCNDKLTSKTPESNFQ